MSISFEMEGNLLFLHYSPSMGTESIKEQLCDNNEITIKHRVTFSNSGTTTMKVALKGFGGQNRGWHTNTVSGTGTRSAVSGNVDHEYQNTSVVYSVY